MQYVCFLKKIVNFYFLHIRSLTHLKKRGSTTYSNEMFSCCKNKKKSSLILACVVLLEQNVAISTIEPSRIQKLCHFMSFVTLNVEIKG